MSNVGYATLQVIPSVRGIGDELRRQIVGPAGEAGHDAGESAGGGFGDSFKGALAALGVEALAEKVGEAFSEAFNQALEQGNVVSTLQAQLGASGPDAAKYGKLVGSLYAKGITENFEQGAEAVRAVVSGGLVDPTATNAQLDSIATKMTDVANVFGTDLSLQTQSVSALLKNGLAPSADAALDVITTGLQKLGPPGEDLLETFQEYPVQLRKLGLDAKTSLGLFQQGLQGGARDTDIIADALKEFSIRAIDMSATSQTAYKALGLDAKGMSDQIAKGGKGASDGLQTVLDRLRAIHDPVKQEAAAVGLFGTQAEDTGKALFNLDPRKAVTAFGDVTGAADNLGSTLRSGPSYEITLFKRTVQQGLVNFIGGKVLPILSKWGKVFDDRVLPPLTVVGGVLASLFLPTLHVLGVALSGTVKWLRTWGAWLAPLAVAIIGIAIALNAEAIATGAVSLVFGIYRGIMLASIGVTNGLAAAQAVLNSVMELNPIALVVIALVALGVAFFVAYQKSETFRAIVQGAWQGIQAAAMLVVGWITGSFLPFFTVTIPGAFGSTIGWVKAHWSLLLGIITGPIGLATYFVVSHWRQIRDGISGAWNSIYAHTLLPMKVFFTSTVPGWANTLKTKVSGAFSSARSAIGTEWAKIEGLTKRPISFVVNTVYNRGIVGVWNKVASAFGAPRLSPFKFATGGPVYGAGTATSDSIPAWLSNDEHVWSAKEVKGAGGHGAVAALRAWAAGGGGQDSAGFKGGGAFGWIGKAANAVSGAGSKAWNTVKKTAGWLKDTLAASARAGVNAVVNPLLNQIPGLGSGYGQMIKRIPNRMVDALFGYADSADKKGASAIAAAGPGNVGRWITKAIQATGVPTSWAGPLRTLVMRESGGNPRAINLTDINAKNGDPSRGLAQTIGATFEHYRLRSLPDDIYNPVANLAAAIRYILSRYGDISRVQQANASKPPAGYDTGGWLLPGATMAVNKTGRPEAVLTAQQWQVMAAQAAAVEAAAGGASRYSAGAGPAPTVVINAGGLDRALLEWLREAVRAKGGGSVQKTLGQGKG